MLFCWPALMSCPVPGLSVFRLSVCPPGATRGQTPHKTRSNTASSCHPASMPIAHCSLPKRTATDAVSCFFVFVFFLFPYTIGDEERREEKTVIAQRIMTFWPTGPCHHHPPAPYFPIVQRSCHFSLFLLLLLLFLLLLLLFFLLGVHLFPRSPAPMFARVLLVENRQSTEFLDTPHHDATNNCLLLFLNNQILIVNIAQFKNEFICPFDLITFP